MKLNKVKYQIRKQLLLLYYIVVIILLGHIIPSEGIKINPLKTEAIIKMPLPKSVNELQRFFGMVNNLEKFIPNLANQTTPLHNFVKREVVFELQKPQLDAIENLKTLITSAPCLNI